MPSIDHNPVVEIKTIIDIALSNHHPIPTTGTAGFPRGLNFISISNLLLTNPEEVS
jgi:hypothetical protein